MWYTRGYENTHLCSTIYQRRTAANPGGIAFVRCLRVASLPDPVGLCSWATSPRDSVPAGLRRPNCAQRDPWLQCGGACRPAPRFFAPPSAAHHLLGRRSPAFERPAASQPPRFRQGPQHLDLGTGRPGQFRAGDHLLRGLRRKRAPSPQTLGNQLEASQALDHQPRPTVPAKKNARDRLIAWASQQLSWAIGFLDEVWWSRFALPRMHARPREDPPVRLREQSWKKEDPDPKALACSGIVWQRGPAQEPIRDQMSL